MNISFQESSPIEIEEGVELQFIKKNMLFGFDNVELERTTEFDIPATPVNNALLAMSNNEHYNGAKVRQRFPVQLQACGVTKAGYLYISGYENGKYKAVFVTGSLLGLKAIKDAGKLSELYPYDSSVIYPYYSEEINPSREGLQDIDIVSYVKDSGKLYPSINLNAVLAGSLQALGFNIVFPDSSIIYRIIPDSVAEMQARPDTITRTWLRDLSETETGILTINEITSTDFDRNFRTRSTAITRHPYEGYRYGRVTQLEPAFDMKIRFPRDTSKYIFIVTFDDAQSTDYITGIKFHGDYELKTLAVSTEGITITTNGAPLAGREVAIAKGTPFIVIDARQDYYRNVYQDRTELTFVPQPLDVFTPNRELLITPIEVASSGVDSSRQPVFLKDNLPDLTIIDGAKSIANMSGTLLTWDEENGVIRFDPADLDTFGKLDITEDVIAVGELTRTFADFGQNNKVAFDNSKNVIEPLELSYFINNVNLEEEKELFKIPFSAGDAIEDGERTLYYESNRYEKTDKPAIAIAGTTTDVYMERVNAPANATIGRLCDTSTQIIVTFRCPLIIFEMITYKTLLHFRGADYVWTELDYSNEQVKATLAKVVI